MPKQLFANNATSSLSGVLTQGGTTLVCAGGEGSRFPTPDNGNYFLLTIFTKDAYANEQQVEVVKVTARSGDVMTIERDAEGLTGNVGGNAYNGSTTTVFLELRWTALGASNTLQASDNLAALQSAAAARTNLGLGSVDNTADLDKPISTATQTALDGKASTGHTHAGVYEPADPTILKDADIGTAVEPVITAGTTGQYWRGDKTWQAFPASGDASTNTATSVDSEVAVFSGTGGKTLKRATGSGIAKLTSGVLSTATAGTDFVSPNGAETLTNKTLTSPTSTGAIYDNGSVRSNIVAMAALDIDCSAGNYFTKTINGNSTFTVSNVPSSLAYAFTLELTHTSGTVTWFANLQWAGGTAPTLTTGKTHLFTFVTDDGGARWRGIANINYVN